MCSCAGLRPCLLRSVTEVDVTGLHGLTGHLSSHLQLRGERRPGGQARRLLPVGAGPGGREPQAGRAPAARRRPPAWDVHALLRSHQKVRCPPGVRLDPACETPLGFGLSWGHFMGMQVVALASAFLRPLSLPVPTLRSMQVFVSPGCLLLSVSQPSLSLLEGTSEATQCLFHGGQRTRGERGQGA